MALVYFDSSALVKLVVDEEGSNIASALWDGCDGVLASRLAYVEVCAALAAALRNRDLSQHDHLSALEAWHEFWAAVRPVELTAAITQAAGELALQHGLRGADAVHLASAAAINSGDLLVAVWDRRLHAGVVSAGLTPAPTELPPHTPVR
jgi:predicted nucleic acid-binding protein